MPSSIAYRFLRCVLYAVLLTPLLVWSIFLFPFITTKILYFRLLVELAVVFYVPLALKYPDLRPRWNWLTSAVWLYMAVLLLTGFLGVDLNHSFWSTVERGEGIVSMLHFAVYFTLLPAVFRTRQDWARYLLAAVASTVAVALYGVAQILSLPIVIHAGATRISGTIGNAAFFAAFVLFGIFLSLYLLYDNPGKRRYLWAVLSLELLVLYHSQTRGAIVGFAAAVILYSVFLIFKGRSRSIRLAAGGVILLFGLSAALLYAGRDSGFVVKHNTLLRLATISVTDITTQSRFDTWRASWKGWQDRFWTGYGYENYNIAFNKYFPARIFKDQGSQIWFDRAHNIILDVAVTSGLIGLIAYLSIFAAAVLSLLKLFRSQSLPWEMPVVLAAMLAAYFLQNIFVFDTQATYVMFFMSLALVSFLQNEYGAPEAGGRGSQSYAAGFFTGTALAVLMFAVAYLVNIEPALANYQATQGIKYAKSQDFRNVIPAFKSALSHGTYMDEEIRQRLVDYAGEAINSGQLSGAEKSEAYQLMIEELKKSIKDSPLDVKNYLYLMNVLNRLGDSPEVLLELFRIGELALALSPTRPQLYFELGQAYFNKRDYDKGLEHFRKAVELNPETKESHVNYMLAATIAGREELAAGELQAILELGYELGAAEHQALARAYFQTGKKQKAVESYRKASELAPQNPDLLARLAAAYAEICDVENAKATVAEVVKLDPDFQTEAEVFLRQLEEKC